MDGNIGLFRSPETTPAPKWTDPLLEACEWSSAGIRWTVRGLDSIARVTMDGVAVPDTDWDFSAGSESLLLLPPADLYDTQPHAIEVSGLCAGKPAKLAARYVATYRYELNVIVPGRIAGWIYDVAWPARQLRLALEFGDGTGRMVAVDLPRPDAADAGQTDAGETDRSETDWGGACGFSADWAPAASGGAASALAIRLEGTGFYPFGRFGFQPGAPGHEPAAVTLVPGPFLRRQGPPRAVVAVRATAIEDAITCLRSLRGAAGRMAQDVIVLDQTGLDQTGLDQTGTCEQSRQALVRAVAEAGFGYHRQAVTDGAATDGAATDGFAAALELAAKLRPDHDVVLLEAGVVVPAGWLDRLYRAAALDPAIAIVVPLSRPLPRTEDQDQWRAEIAAACATLAPGTVWDVPQAAGPCLYIRRDALDQLGLLAGGAAAWDRLPASAAALSARLGALDRRIVAAADLFVADLRSGPAATPPAVTDPLRRVHNRLQIALWRGRGPIVVFVTLALPGGTSRHVAHLTRALERAGRLVLWLGHEPEFREPGSGTPLLLREPDGSAVTCYSGEDDLEAALADVFALAPEFIHVHHLIDLPPAIETYLRRSGIPFAVTLHDYFYGCPRVTLLDEGGAFCDVPPVEHCTRCLAAGSLHAAFSPSLLPLAETAEGWRTKWGRFLLAAAQVIAPSRAAAYYYRKLFPELVTTIRPHPADPGTPLLLEANEPGRAPRNPARVAIIGAISPHKGAAELHELVRYCSRWEPDLRFVLVGYSDRDAALARHGNVELRGSYASDTVAAAITEADCATALFLSIWPETYCFTLSEALAEGLVPVAFDIGALGERLRDLATGVLVPPHSRPEVIVAAIRKAAAEAPPRPIPAGIDADYPDLLRDYYSQHLTGHAACQPAMVLGSAVGLTEDLWCEQHFALSLCAPAPLREIVLHLWYHPGHLPQHCRLRADDGPVHRIWLEPDQTWQVAVPLPDPSATLYRITGVFDFATSLDPPDKRRCAAKLVGLSAVEAAGRRSDYRITHTEEDGASVFHVSHA